MSNNAVVFLLLLVNGEGGGLGAERRAHRVCGPSMILGTPEGREVVWDFGFGV